MIEIKIRGEPVPWSRAGRIAHRSFTPVRQKEAMRLIGYEARAQMGTRPLLEGPLELHLIFAYSWPKTASRKRRDGSNLKESRPDLDNLLKLVCDSLNTVVWRDDAQVAEMTAIKVYAPIPSVSILVSEVSPSYTGESSVPIHSEAGLV